MRLSYETSFGRQSSWIDVHARIVLAAGKVEIPVLLEPLQELEILHHLALDESLDRHRLLRELDRAIELALSILCRFNESCRTLKLATLRASVGSYNLTHYSYSCFALNLTFCIGTS